VTFFIEIYLNTVDCDYMDWAVFVIPVAKVYWDGEIKLIVWWDGVRGDEIVKKSEERRRIEQTGGGYQ